MKLYFNGRLILTNPYEGSFAGTATDWTRRIGMRNEAKAGETTGFHGQIDEFRVWNVARTEDQIRERRGVDRLDLSDRPVVANLSSRHVQARQATSVTRTNRAAPAR